MPLFIQEKATIACGDDGPDNVKIHNLESVQLPDLEEISENHHAGGSISEVDWGGLGMKALAPTFKLKGWDPQIMSLLAQRERKPFTVRGTVRNKQTQKLVGVKAVFFARLGKISGDSFEAGKVLGHDHALIEVVHYELYFDGVEKYFWDEFACTFRVDGNDMLSEERALLGLPGA